MLALILGLAILGLILWFIETKIPMDESIRLLIRIVVVIAVIVYLARLFGFADLPVPRIH